MKCVSCGWVGIDSPERCPNCSSPLALYGEEIDPGRSGGDPGEVVDHPGRVIDPDDLVVAREGIAALIRVCGGDPKSPVFARTPDRVIHALAEMTSGEDESLSDVLGSGLDDEPENYGGVVVLRRHPFVSVCEHHLLPFTGFATVAYDGRVVRLSKIARLVDTASRRLQLQERITAQVVEALVAAPLAATGAACVLDAEHQCMACRGVRSSARVRTSLFRGSLADSAIRAEILADARA